MCDVREIDALAHDPYGLTEEEIAIVEGAGSLKALIPLKGVQ